MTDSTAQILTLKIPKVTPVSTGFSDGNAAVVTFPTPLDLAAVLIPANEDILGKRRFRFAAPSEEIMALCAFMGLLQILDGVLTGLGVFHFGVGAEGNMFLRVLMESIGYVPALAIAKSFSIAILVLLSFVSSSVPWVGRALKGIILVYLVAAILPWTAILVGEFWV